MLSAFLTSTATDIAHSTMISKVDTGNYVEVMCEIISVQQLKYNISNFQALLQWLLLGYLLL